MANVLCFSVRIFLISTLALLTHCSPTPPLEAGVAVPQSNTGQAGGLQAVSWPRVPPAFVNAVPSTSYDLTFSRADAYTRKPQPQPSDLYQYVREFRDQLADKEGSSDTFTTQIAKDRFIDVESFTSFKIQMRRIGWSTKLLATDDVLKALDTLAALIRNHQPAVLTLVIADKANTKGYYEITTDLVAFAEDTIPQAPGFGSEDADSAHTEDDSAVTAM